LRLNGRGGFRARFGVVALSAVVLLGAILFIAGDVALAGTAAPGATITNEGIVSRLSGHRSALMDDTSANPANSVMRDTHVVPGVEGFLRLWYSNVCHGAVVVTPATNLQNTIQSHPPGTTFCFSPGTYLLKTYVTPKSDDRLISVPRRKAVLTGLDRYPGGIQSYNRDVLVQGFVIRDFDDPWPTFPRSPLQVGNHWTVRDNEISHNSESGVSLGSGTRLVGNWIHHNGRYGFTGGPAIDIVVKYNEVSFNNTRHYDPHDDAGGSKIIQSSRVEFTGNYVHDNYGNGLWCDWANIYVTYSNNVLARNFLAGIFHEASARAVIRDNTFTDNGTYAKGQSIWFAADLQLNDSKDTSIYGNKIVAGFNGIALIDEPRGSTIYGLLEIRDVSVHDNIITLPPGGGDGLVSLRPAFTPVDVRFSDNTYVVSDPTAALWAWPPTYVTWQDWQQQGNDLTGVRQYDPAA
jgi:parallel beta-helix repeat protein